MSQVSQVELGELENTGMTYDGKASQEMKFFHFQRRGKRATGRDHRESHRIYLVSFLSFFFCLFSNFQASVQVPSRTSGASTRQNEHSAFIRAAQRYPVCRIDLINQHQAESSRMSQAGQPSQASQPASQPATPRRD